MKRHLSTGRILLATTVGFLLLSGFTQAQEKKTMSFTDVVSLKRVSSPALAPDGEQLLFTISTADWERNETVSHIWKVNTDGGGLLQLTNGEGGEQGGKWSPDGRFIAFITKRSEEPQIHLIHAQGGEAVEFTHHKGGVRSFEWAPDGKSIYFLADDPLSEAEEKRKEEQDDAYIFENDFKHRHLWVIGTESKKESRITEGDFTISGFKLSRDGSHLVCLAAPTPLYDDSVNAEIWIMDLADNSMRRITENRIGESNIALSPDNSQILFVAEANAEFVDYHQSALFIVPAAGGEPTPVLPDFPYEISTAVWSADGRYILFTANMGVHSQLFYVNLSDLKTEQLTNGLHAIYGFDFIPGINQTAYMINTPHNPGTFWMSKLEDFSPVLIHDPYPELKAFRLAKYEVVRWKSTDDVEVEGVLIYPIDYEEGTRCPLLAHTHGGPMGSDKFTFDGYAHARAGRGYAVFKPNYRGSTGYGNPFLRDMVGHYFLHADDDVITGVQALIQRGIADPDKMGTLGWSAGGHMTNWLVTQTDMFKAASSGAGASNWISMYAQSDVRIYRTPWFLGNPWQPNAPLSTYRQHSPVFFAHQAKTPTLILFGENDRRVPLPQGVEMYRALKANQVPTELVIFPRSGHGPRELRHRLYKMNKEFHWLEKHIRGKEFTFDSPPPVKN